MPNYIKNEVYALNKTKELIAAFRGKDAYGEEKDVTFNAIVPTPEDVYLGDIGANSPAKNWYAFNTENWGTKWDACDVSVDEDHVMFTTAWSTPEPIIKALAKKIDDVVFCIFADEDIGSNCGAYAFTPEGEMYEIKAAEMFAAYFYDGDEPDEYVRRALEWRME